MKASTLSLLLSLCLPAVAYAADRTGPVVSDRVVADRVVADRVIAHPAITDLVITDPVVIEAAPLRQADKAADRAAQSRTALAADASVSTGAVSAADIAPARTMRVSEVVLQALSLLGTPYRWGGNSSDAGFDCSGLVKHVIEQALGLVLPRSAIAMSRLGAQVERPRLQPGDLLFFVTRRQDVSHVGIYVGDSRFVHANRHGGEVTLSSLENKYWASRLAVARRVEPQ